MYLESLTLTELTDLSVADLAILEIVGDDEVESDIFVRSPVRSLIRSPVRPAIKTKA